MSDFFTLVKVQGYLLDSIQCEVGSSLSGGVKLNPHGDGQLGQSLKGEGDNKASGAGLGLVGKVQVIIDLDGLATVLAGQVEGAAAVEVVDEIDASGSWGTDTGYAVVNVLFAVLAGVACGQKIRIL